MLWVVSNHKHVPIVGIQFPNYFIIVQNEFEVVGVAQNKELFNDAPKVEGQTNINFCYINLN
jgi:hypothetical protein